MLRLGYRSSNLASCRHFDGRKFLCRHLDAVHTFVPLELYQGNTWYCLKKVGGSKSLSRVARWHIFKPKIVIWVNFWRDLQWKMLVYDMDIWYILGPFGIFCGHSVYFILVWHIFSQFWYVVPRKIWQPLNLISRKLKGGIMTEFCIEKLRS
jgi:hypothetical protein